MLDKNINWFPGHMKKATDHILKVMDRIDVVLEVVDARCIQASSNYELINIFKNKPIVKIALKADLCDLSPTSSDVLLVSTKNKQDYHKILQALYEVVSPKMEKLKSKGLANPQFTVIVVGLPNIGKSSLINFLAPKKTLVAQNKAGVTKTQAMRKINNHFFLIDTPGIFVKKIDDINIGYQLALINTINKNILPLTSINQYYHNFMQQHYPQTYLSYFNLTEPLSYTDFVQVIAQDKNFKLKGNEWDIDKTEQYLFNIYVNAMICRYHFDE